MGFGSVRTDAFIVALILFLGIAEFGIISRFSTERTGAPVTEIVAEVQPPDIVVPPVDSAEPITGPPETAFITLFGTGYNSQMWYRSEFDNPKSFYGVDWREENVSMAVNGLELAIQNEDNSSNSYTAAELQSHEFYQYGRYEVVMRPAKGSGLVSSFFTYTGPYHGDPHDEVDIEFLGRNTRQVHFNYYRGGKVGASKTIELPFDAADDNHLYAFEWRADGIEWFVDGVPTYRTEIGDTHIPHTAGKIIMNLWTGKPFMQQWHGRPGFENDAAAEYACVSYRPLETVARSCATFYLPLDQGAETELAASGSWVSREIITAGIETAGHARD